MKLIANILLLVIGVEAARCKTKCKDPFELNIEECKCVCVNSCEAQQDQN